MKQKGFISLPLIALIGAILMLGIGFVIGKNYQSKSYQMTINKLTDQLWQVQHTLDLANQDLGEQVGTSSETYDYSKFGIYSTLFNDKTVQVTTFQYKDQTITERVLKVKSEGSSEISVSVWQSSATSNPTYQVDKNFVIFDGYENYLYHPTSVADITKGWSENSDLYKNPRPITMHYSYNDYGPEFSTQIVSLSFYEEYPSFGHPIFVQISEDNIDGGDKQSAKVLQAKKDLQSIADTISLQILSN